MNHDLLIELHKGQARQGPGGVEQTKMAITLSGLSARAGTLKIADIGCGTGASALVLAEHLNADITAIDLSPAFLSILNTRARQKGLTGSIRTWAGCMDDLPFRDGDLDAIWSEGAIYNMGFAKGIAYFKRFLKPGGILAVSEITWLTPNRPHDIVSYWNDAYPEIAAAADKITSLENQGFILKGYFPLPETCWTDNYYTPLQNSFAGFLAKNDSHQATAIVDAEINEIKLYKKHRKCYSYGFYVGQKA